jgi:two-component system nitrate/nitrite response regulator NarL
VVLLDLRMPGAGGIDILQRMRAEGSDRRVAMLTTSTEEPDLIASLQAGANGYLLKDMEPDDLVAALQDIVGGKTVVANELTDILARAVRQEKTEPRRETAFADLTPREMEILCHLAAGKSNKAIARDLGISDGTVKLHVKAILRKLDVHSRVEAAVMAVEQGLCSRD